MRYKYVQQYVTTSLCMFQTLLPTTGPACLSSHEYVCINICLNMVVWRKFPFLHGGEYIHFPMSQFLEAELNFSVLTEIS